MLAFARFTRSERESRPSRINNLDVYYLQNIGEIYFFFSAVAHLLLNKNPFCKEVADSAATPLLFHDPQIVKDDRMVVEKMQSVFGEEAIFAKSRVVFLTLILYSSLRPKILLCN